MAEGERLRSAALIVGSIGIGDDGVAGIGHDDDLVSAVGEARGQCRRERARVRSPRDQPARLAHRAEQRGVTQLAIRREVDVVRPRAGRRRAADILNLPGHRLGLPRLGRGER